MTFTRRRRRRLRARHTTSATDASKAARTAIIIASATGLGRFTSIMLAYYNELRVFSSEQFRTGLIGLMRTAQRYSDVDVAMATTLPSSFTTSARV